jgi:uncharacterized MnhB-related membrane protein
VRPWIKYTLYRIVVFAVLLAVLLVLRVDVFISAFIAAILGLVISALFFRKLRDKVALELAERRENKPPATRDDAEEDSLNAE